MIINIINFIYFYFVATTCLEKWQKNKKVLGMECLNSHRTTWIPQMTLSWPKLLLIVPIMLIVAVMGKRKIAAQRPKAGWTHCWRVSEMMKTMTS